MTSQNELLNLKFYFLIFQVSNSKEVLYKKE